MSVIPLTMHRDDRGTFTEMFRHEWDTGVSPVQWNVVRSEANVLRGVHVHRVHADYLAVLDGEARVGLRDLRPSSPTHGVADEVRLTGSDYAALVIPPGVAHGFYFPCPSMHLYSVSHYWSTADELGCRWDDPRLGLPWSPGTPHISPRDAALPSLSDLEATLRDLEPVCSPPPGRA